MKKYLISILLLFCALQVKSQVASSCAPSAALVHSYENDCRYLALQHLYNTHSPDTIYIEIPNQYYDTVMAGMAAICNTGSAIFADSIFNNYCVHEYRIPFSFQVSYDPAIAWSGTAIDTFCRLHGVMITGVTSISGYFLATLTANRVINIKAFGDSLLHFPGIYSASYLSLIVGDGSHITFAGGSNRQYAFQLGWGDCLSGCMNSKVWTYTVDTLCNVSLVSVTTSGIYPGPAPLRNCNLNPLSVTKLNDPNPFNVYPNPATTELHLEASTQDLDLPYTLSDIYGRTVRSGIITKSAIVDIYSLPAGMYLLSISGTYRNKVIKL